MSCSLKKKNTQCFPSVGLDAHGLLFHPPILDLKENISWVPLRSWCLTIKSSLADLNRLPLGISEEQEGFAPTKEKSQRRWPWACCRVPDQFPHPHVLLPYGVAQDIFHGQRGEQESGNQVEEWEMEMGTACLGEDVEVT